MKWLGDLPVPVPSAWNVLCDATAERMAFYGLPEMAELKLPEVPFKPTNQQRISTLISKMRGTLRLLVECSFEEEYFGKWSSLKTPEQLSTPDDPRFERWGIDGYAFFMTPEYLPSRCYRTTDFIHAAAKLINDVIRYPMPLFINNTVRENGFFINADLLAEDFESGETFSGTVAENWQLRNETIMQFGNHLANWYKNDYYSGAWRGKSSGHRWIYRPGVHDLPGTGFNFISPELRGRGKIRSKIKMTDGHDNREEKFSGDLQEFTMDFSSGTADRQITFPEEVVQAARDTWNGSDSQYSRRTVSYQLEQREVMLYKENFPDLPYTYME